MRLVRSRSGSSTLEVAATVLILGILASAAVSTLGPRLELQQLQQGSDALLQAMQQAQQQAIRQGQSYRVEIDPAGNRYALVPVVGAPATPNWLVLPSQVEIDADATISTFPKSGSNYQITFDSIGAVTAVGAIGLRGKNGNSARTLAQITINQLVGTIQTTCTFPDGHISEKCA